jgi:hypothetical protein
MKETVMLQVNSLYHGKKSAKLSSLDTYIKQVREIAGEGNDVILTGQGPIWLYLKIAHALHGVARKLIYRSPVTGDVLIFDHSPD